MTHLEESIEVEVPVRTAYNQWTQFEDFPLFMEGVKEVRQLDAKRLTWRAEVAGKEVTWDAEITQQVPDRRISWRSTSGAPNAGGVSFYPLGADKTKVTLSLEYEPSGMAQNAAAALGIVRARINGDLKHFKEFIESRGQATGAWRGEISGGAVHQAKTQPSSERRDT